MTDTTEYPTIKGAGLARGPALIVGAVLAVFGLMLFFRAAGTPLSTAGFSSADVQGQKLFGFEANAWTAWLTTAAGVLVLFGAAQHLVAKTMSLIVGLALAAAAVIALIDGDVLGLAAANGLTILGWGVAAVLLLMNSLMPRLHRKAKVVERERVVEPDRAERHSADERIQHDDSELEPWDDTQTRERVTSERAVDTDGTVAGDETLVPQETGGRDRTLVERSVIGSEDPTRIHSTEQR